VVTGVVALVMSNRSAHPLPIVIVNVAVIAAAAATLAVLLHEKNPGNGLWRVLLVRALAGPTAVVVLLVAANQSKPPPLPTGPAVRPRARDGAIGFVAACATAIRWPALSGSGSWPARRAASLAGVGVGGAAVASALWRWGMWILDRALRCAVSLSGASAGTTV